MTANGQTSNPAHGDSQSPALAPAAALRDLYSAIGEALASAAQNAVAAQQQAQVLAQAVTNQGVATLYSIDTAALGEATKKAIDNN